MASIYADNKQLDDDMLINLLLMATDEDLEASITDAESDDPERAERLRMRVTEAQLEWRQRAAATTDERGTSEEQEGTEAEDDEPAADNLLMTQDGQLLDGIYSFTVNVIGWLQLDQNGQFAAFTADPMDLPLGTYGTIDVNAGVPGEPLVTPPPPPEDEPAGPLFDPSQHFAQNVGILNAMFVDGAGASQRTARVLTNGLGMVLKNIHDGYQAEQQAGFGVGTINFTRNRMSPNEITVADEGGLDVAYVKEQIKDLLDQDVLQYTYRDKSRVKFR
jgi:hypothetical protein